MALTFRTIASEIRNHRWELQEMEYLPVMTRLADLMDEAEASTAAGDSVLTKAKMADYWALYKKNVENLK